MKTSRWALAIAAAGLCGCAGSQVKPDAKPIAKAKPAAPAAPVIPNKAVLPPPAQARSATSELLEKGAAAYRAGRLDEAKATFEKAIEQSPNDPKGHFDLGLTLDRQGDFKGAGEQYTKAHTLAPQDPGATLHLARLYRDGGNLDRAVAVYEESLRANPNEPTLLNALAATYRLKKDYAKAEASARQALAHGGEVEAYKNLALIALDQGNLRLAELLCANARKLAPNDPGVYNDLGLVYLKEADLPRALGQFQKAVSIDSTFAPAFVNLGALALRYRDYSGAQKNLAQAVKLAPTDPALHLALAYALDGQKGLDAKKGVAAGEEFERTLAIQPENAEAICGAAWAYTADKASFAKAKGFLERCRTLASTQAEEKQRIDDKLKALAVMMPAPGAVEDADANGDQDPPTDDDTEIATQPAPGGSQGIGGSGPAMAPAPGPQSGSGSTPPAPQPDLQSVSPSGAVQPAAAPPPTAEGGALDAKSSPASPGAKTPDGTGSTLPAPPQGDDRVSPSGSVDKAATQPVTATSGALDAAQGTDPSVDGNAAASTGEESSPPTDDDASAGDVSVTNAATNAGAAKVSAADVDASARGAGDTSPGAIPAASQGAGGGEASAAQ